MPRKSLFSGAELIVTDGKIINSMIFPQINITAMVWFFI